VLHTAAAEDREICAFGYKGQVVAFTDILRLQNFVVKAAQALNIGGNEANAVEAFHGMQSPVV
jgi:hypothetical protein